MKDDKNTKSRRDFLKESAALSAGIAALGTALGQGQAATRSQQVVKAKYAKSLPNKVVTCELCPFHCTLTEGQRCICRTRFNKGGVLYTDAYNTASVFTVAPVEKAPFHHFLPGKPSLTIAASGCNLRCNYCQNWKVSQKQPSQTPSRVQLTPKEVVQKAQKHKLPVIAFNFTEPVVYYEYMYDIAKEAKAANIRTVMGSAGYIETAPLQDLCKVIDGFAITLKSFSDTFYRKVCSATLAPVLKSIEEIRKQGRWLEIVVLLVPSLNDSSKEIKKMSQWIVKHVGKDVPIHFNRFFPDFHFRKNFTHTPVATLDNARKIAQSEGIRYVYVGNVHGHTGSHTSCASCKKPIIQRVGFTLHKNHLKKGQCPHCQHKIPGVWS